MPRRPRRDDPPRRVDVKEAERLLRPLSPVGVDYRAAPPPPPPGMTRDVTGLRPDQNLQVGSEASLAPLRSQWVMPQQGPRERSEVDIDQIIWYMARNGYPKNLRQLRDAAKWIFDPNAKPEDMPPSALVADLIIGLFPGIGDVQSVRDVWRDVTQGNISGWTGLAAAGALPLIPSTKGVVTAMKNAERALGDASAAARVLETARAGAAEFGRVMDPTRNIRTAIRERFGADAFRRAGQTITSEGTSLDQLPAMFSSKAEQANWHKGGVNLDLGGGISDNATNSLRERGVDNILIDPYARDAQWNERELERLVEAGGADTATLSNVLNVIDAPDARALVLDQARQSLREGGQLYVTVYEGTGKGGGRATSKGWQENRKVKDYIKEVENVFGAENVSYRNGVITATAPTAGEFASGRALLNTTASAPEFGERVRAGEQMIEGARAARAEEGVASVAERGLQEGRRGLERTGEFAKPVSEWTPEMLQRYGESWGIPNLGKESPMVPVRLADGSEAQIPGGFDGEWSYLDLLRMKAQGIDVSQLDQAEHVKLQQKLLRTMSGGRELTDPEMWRSLLLGLGSPNNPLTPNEFQVARMMPQSMDDVAELAAMADPSLAWRALGDPAERARLEPEILRKWNDPKKKVRRPQANSIADIEAMTNVPRVGNGADWVLNQVMDTLIGERYGLQAANEFAPNALGARGSANYWDIAKAAALYMQDPSFFRLKEGEDWGTLVERVSSQITGLGPKTASLGVVWQDLPGAQISAIDRHMANIFREAILADPARRAVVEGRLVEKWNAAGRPHATSIADIEGMRGGTGAINEMLMDEIYRPGNYSPRLASGAPNPRVPEELRDVNWIEEPKKVVTISEPYRMALAANEAAAQSTGLSVFGEQWRLWDRWRQRFEPHEVMFPGLNRMPRMPQEEVKKAYDLHSALGYLNSPSRVLPTSNPQALAYWGLLGGAGLGMGARAIRGDKDRPNLLNPDTASLLGM